MQNKNWENINTKCINCGDLSDSITSSTDCNQVNLEIGRGTCAHINSIPWQKGYNYMPEIAQRSRKHRPSTTIFSQKS